MIKLALLISGGGTTATAICNACKPGGVLHGLVTPSLVIASSPEAKGRERIYATGVIPAANLRIIDPKTLSEEQFGHALTVSCIQQEIDIIGQYGWMPKTPQTVIDGYRGRMINQHPGPLDTGYPGFGGQGMYGRRVHCARLWYARNTDGNMWTEVVGQRVHPEWDKGEVLRAEQVEILRNDTVEDLQARCLPVEHKVQIDLLQDFAQNDVQVVTRPERLIRPHERNTLAMAKMIARTLYPEG